MPLYPKDISSAFRPWKTPPFSSVFELFCTNTWKMLFSLVCGWINFSSCEEMENENGSSCLPEAHRQMSSHLIFRVNFMYRKAAECTAPVNSKKIAAFIEQLRKVALKDITWSSDWRKANDLSKLFFQFKSIKGMRRLSLTFFFESSPPEWGQLYCANPRCKSHPSALHLQKGWNGRLSGPSQKGESRWMSLLCLSQLLLLRNIPQVSSWFAAISAKGEIPVSRAAAFNLPPTYPREEAVWSCQSYKTPSRDNLHSRLAAARCSVSQCVLLQLPLLARVDWKLFRAGTMFCCVLVQCSGLAGYPWGFTTL